jgi:hypothetical protein
VLRKKGNLGLSGSERKSSFCYEIRTPPDLIFIRRRFELNRFLQTEQLPAQADRSPAQP